MRIWDIAPSRLCRKHLLGEHRELHAVWSILTGDKKGYRNHPETQRWEGKLKALYSRHEALVREMTIRGYKHFSPLEIELAVGYNKQDILIDSIVQQESLLTSKPCQCLLD